MTFPVVIPNRLSPNFLGLEVHRSGYAPTHSGPGCTTPYRRHDADSDPSECNPVRLGLAPASVPEPPKEPE